MLDITDKSYALTAETFDSLSSYWVESGQRINWECLFVLPAWLKVWFSIFSNGLAPYLHAVRHGGELIGISPLLVQGKKACFIGDPDVCDYLDFIVAPGRGREFFAILIEHLRQKSIIHLDLRPVRADSTVLSELAPVAKDLDCEVSCHREDVTLEFELPGTWDEFLLSLTGKQRHEIRRKIRRLHEAAHIRYRIVKDIQEVRDEMGTFLSLFGSNRSDKAAFMTSQMAYFFRSLAEAMAELKILKLFFLDLDATPAAAVMCFDYNSVMYLYNSGYDQRFRSLSVGLLSKVLSIQDSIQRGKKKYSFLKGDEAYKFRLGGNPIPLYRCQVKIHK